MNATYYELGYGLAAWLVLAADAAITWSADGWATVNHLDAVAIAALKLWFADLPIRNYTGGTTVEFTFFWKEAQRWDGTNYAAVTSNPK